MVLGPAPSCKSPDMWGLPCNLPNLRVFARRGLFVTRHHCQSFCSQSNADSRRDPSNAPRNITAKKCIPDLEQGFREMRNIRFSRNGSFFPDFHNQGGRTLRNGRHHVEARDSTEILMQSDLKSVRFSTRYERQYVNALSFR